MVKLNHLKKVIILNPLNLDMRKTMKKNLCVSIYYLTYLFFQNNNVVQLANILESKYS